MFNGTKQKQQNQIFKPTCNNAQTTCYGQMKKIKFRIDQKQQQQK